MEDGSGSVDDDSLGSVQRVAIEKTRTLSLMLSSLGLVLGS